MQKPTDTGMNRTGVATSPIDSRRTASGAEPAPTGGMLDGHALAAERITWARIARRSAPCRRRRRSRGC